MVFHSNRNRQHSPWLCCFFLKAFSIISEKPDEAGCRPCRISVSGGAGLNIVIGETFCNFSGGSNIFAACRRQAGGAIAGCNVCGVAGRADPFALQAGFSREEKVRLAGSKRFRFPGHGRSPGRRKRLFGSNALCGTVKDASWNRIETINPTIAIPTVDSSWPGPAPRWPPTPESGSGSTGRLPWQCRRRG